MTNRTPYIPDDKRAEWEESCFKNEPEGGAPAAEKPAAKFATKRPAAKPAAKRKAK